MLRLRNAWSAPKDWTLEDDNEAFAHRGLQTLGDFAVEDPDSKERVLLADDEDGPSEVGTVRALAGSLANSIRRSRSSCRRFDRTSCSPSAPGKASRRPLVGRHGTEDPLDRGRSMGLVAPPWPQETRIRSPVGQFQHVA